MKKIESDVTMSVIDLICPKCRKGLMLSKSDIKEILARENISKELHLHICDMCNHTEYLDKQYPELRYQRSVSRKEMIGE